AAASSETRSARSAPMASALRMASSARSGPMETSTTSPPPVFSLIRRASSTAFASKALSPASPLRSIRFDCGSIRFAAPASGTCLTQTAIFTARNLSERVRRPAGKPARVMPPKREPVRVITRRSTTLGVALVATLVSAATFVAPSSAIPPKHPVPQLVFPVVGQTTYHDDFGDPRGNGKHEGNDLMAAWRSPAVAAESGKIKFWTKSARAGCMLYLYGKSGTTYQYIHLNNDLTEKHDNKGKCIAGTAYMDGLKDGANVQAGQQIGYVGDSGDAEGTYHLHFEVHPNDGAAVSPFPYLQKAVHLLVPVNPKLRVSLSVQGHVVRYAANRMTVSLTSMTLFPG